MNSNYLTTTFQIFYKLDRRERISSCQDFQCQVSDVDTCFRTKITSILTKQIYILKEDPIGFTQFLGRPPQKMRDFGTKTHIIEYGTPCTHTVFVPKNSYFSLQTPFQLLPLRVWRPSNCFDICSTNAQPIKVQWQICLDRFR